MPSFWQDLSKCGKQRHCPVKSQEKNHAPSASTNKVNQTSAMQEYAGESNESQCGSEIESDDSILVTERVEVVNS